MDKKNLSRKIDDLIRGGLCACWIFSVPMMILFWVMSTGAQEPADQDAYAIKAVVCFGVLVLGASAHAIMLNIRDEENKNG